MLIIESAETEPRCSSSHSNFVNRLDPNGPNRMGPFPSRVTDLHH